jgi:hypothetical protein
MEAAQEENKVLAHIQELINKPKQYADRVFEEPKKPSFLDDDDEPDDEDDGVLDEIHTEASEVRKGDDVRIETEQDLEMFTGSFLAITTFVIEKAISLMSGEDFSYDLDKTEEKNLRKQAEVLLKSKKVKARPQTWFMLTLSAIYGIPLVEAFITMNKRIWKWYKGRGAKKEEAAKLAAAEAAKLNQLRQEQAEAEQSETIEYIKKLEQKLSELEARKEQPKATTQDPKPAKAKLDIPDHSQTKAPTLEQLASKHSAGLCLAPGCGHKLGGNEFFHANACRIAYSGASQRKADPFPLVRDFKKYLEKNPKA